MIGLAGTTLATGGESSCAEARQAGKGNGHGWTGPKLLFSKESRALNTHGAAERVQMRAQESEIEGGG